MPYPIISTGRPATNLHNTFEIINSAKNRKLDVGEIECLMDIENTPLAVVTNPPTSPPNSGALFLYDRNKTRSYKVDGYEWVKKPGKNKVREDHVKLRGDHGEYRVAGNYSLCVTVPGLRRFVYKLLDASTGRTKDPYLFSKENRQGKQIQSSFVLVHYLLEGTENRKRKCDDKEMTDKKNCTNKEKTKNVKPDQILALPKQRALEASQETISKASSLAFRHEKRISISLPLTNSCHPMNSDEQHTITGLEPSMINAFSDYTSCEESSPDQVLNNTWHFEGHNLPSDRESLPLKKRCFQRMSL